MAINAEWHEKHPMPKNATLEQRIVWHTEHRKACACRPMPAKLVAVIEERSAGGRPEQLVRASKTVTKPRR